MTDYTLTVSTTQPTALIGIPAPGDTLPLEDLGLDPNAVAAPVEPPIYVSESMDPRWELRDSDTQPASVGLSVALGQIAFRLSQATTEETTVLATASGPYRLRDSAVHWQNAAFPATWGDAGSVTARARLRGNLGTADTYAIDVIFTDGQIIVSHTDADEETVDFTSDLNAPPPGRRAAEETQTFQWLRIESDGAGTDFWVYASVDGILWQLLVRQTMSADMQAAFVRSTLEFSMTAEGTSAAGAWVIGSINVAAEAATYPGIYLQDRDQAGFAYNAGVWNQFGPPLDGYRPGYTFDSDNGRYEDPSGGPHYYYVDAVAYAQNDPNVVYATVLNHAVLFISHDGGLSWSSRPIPGIAQDPQPEGVDPTAPLSWGADRFNLASPQAGEVEVMYFNRFKFANPGIWHTTDEGTTWTRVAEFTTNPSASAQVMRAGDMRASSGKVWWAEQTGRVTGEPEPGAELGVPRWRIVWSDSLAWSIGIDEFPDDQPILTIPPLDISQYTLTDGTTRSAARVYIVCSTPGLWQPDIGKMQLMLWTDGLVSSWQNPEEIPGIKGLVGYTEHAQPVLRWQPSTVSDEDVATYWAMTDDMAGLTATRKAWIKLNPEAPSLPPELTLPDMGGYGGAWQTATVMTETADVPEPVNARAGVTLSQGTSGESFLHAFGYGEPTDYMLSVTPNHPENSAQTVQAIIPNLEPGGGKIHVNIYADITRPPAGAETGFHSVRKSPLTMQGCLSVVVVDVEPDDLPLYQVVGGPAMSVTSTGRAVGGSTWNIVDGGPAYTVMDSRLYGPPSHEREVAYKKLEHATWIYEEQLNYPTLPVSMTLVPGMGVGADEIWTGGLLLATQVVFGDEPPAIPDGWELVADTDVSQSGSAGTGGYLHDAETGTPFSGVSLNRGQTGKWVPGLIPNLREYIQRQMFYDLLPMRQRVLSRPFAGDPPVTVELGAHTAPYWFVAAEFGGLLREPAGGGTPAPVTAENWSIKRANFDGSATETVGSITFETNDDPSGSGLGPLQLQVRPFSDDLCLVTNNRRNGIWRVQSGNGAIPIWPPALQAVSAVWDTVALDANTFVTVSSVPWSAEAPDAFTVYVYRSTDAGATWERLATIPPADGFAMRGRPDEWQTLAAPDADNVVMLGMAGPENQQILWMSNDGGRSWFKNYNWADPYFEDIWQVVRPGGLVTFPGTRPVITGVVRGPQASIVG